MTSFFFFLTCRATWFRLVVSRRFFTPLNIKLLTGDVFLVEEFEGVFCFIFVVEFNKCKIPLLQMEHTEWGHTVQGGMLGQASAHLIGNTRLERRTRDSYEEETARLGQSGQALATSSVLHTRTPAPNVNTDQVAGKLRPRLNRGLLASKVLGKQRRKWKKRKLGEIWQVLQLGNTPAFLSFSILSNIQEGRLNGRVK